VWVVNTTVTSDKPYFVQIILAAGELGVPQKMAEAVSLHFVAAVVVEEEGHGVVEVVEALAWLERYELGEFVGQVHVEQSVSTKRRAN
jgi:hypothetical protein